jgi:hypothetical protein
MTVTRKKINAAVAAIGGTEELTKGRGYWYFAGGTSCDWPSSAVYVYSLADLTLAQWIEEYHVLRSA